MGISRVCKIRNIMTIAHAVRMRNEHVHGRRRRRRVAVTVVLLLLRMLLRLRPVIENVGARHGQLQRAAREE